jgi:hypothetical protein
MGAEQFVLVREIAPKALTAERNDDDDVQRRTGTWDPDRLCNRRAETERRIRTKKTIAVAPQEAARRREACDVELTTLGILCDL